MAARKRQPKPKTYRTVQSWFDDHAHADEFVKLWLTERKAKRSTKSVSWLHRHLIEKWRFPFPGDNTLQVYLVRTYGERYHEAIA